MNRNYDVLSSREVRYLLDFLLDHIDVEHRRKLASELPAVTAKLGVLNVGATRAVIKQRLDEVEQDPRAPSAFEVSRVKRSV